MKIKLSDPIVRRPLTDEQLASLSREDLLVIARNEHRLRLFLEGYVHELEEKVFECEGKFFRVRAKMFSPSTEKSRPGGKRTRIGKGGKGNGTKSKLPSDRYPDAEIIDKHITCESDPACKCCGSQMADSGMTETSEYLTVIPKRYIIIRQHRHKYRCTKCHGDIVTTPPIPRVIPGSSYSDEMIIDAALSKYCDLIPMERYCQIAKRQGFEGLPPQSLIAATFKLADFLKVAYDRLRLETLDTPVLLADETTHRMLEGDEKTGWHLWGFSTEESCFYECHDTRSGDVATTVLNASTCSVLVSDVYAGYKKAVREANELRHAQGQPLIQMAFCNSHARRGFKSNEFEASDDAEFMVDNYKKIYALNETAKGQAPAHVSEIRNKMRPFFADMKAFSEGAIHRFSSKSGIYRAFNYFLSNYDGLTLFLDNPKIPIDNNASERLLRGPVVGRKTWYGTHSKDGAEAGAIHFSLVEACKLVNANPRTYYKELVARLHAKKAPITPREFLAELHDPMIPNETS